jgi:hypothetical protein
MGISNQEGSIRNTFDRINGILKPRRSIFRTEQDQLFSKMYAINIEVNTILFRKDCCPYITRLYLQLNGKGLDRLTLHSNLDSICKSWFRKFWNPETAALPFSPITQRPILPQTSVSESQNLEQLNEILRGLVNRLCEWAVSSSSPGDHRAYLTASLLHQFIYSSWTLLAPYLKRTMVHESLMAFLDHFHYDLHPDKIATLCLLFGELIRVDVFSISQYIHRIISRGLLETTNNTNGIEKHRAFLQGNVSCLNILSGFILQGFLSFPNTFRSRYNVKFFYMVYIVMNELKNSNYAKTL